MVVLRHVFCMNSIGGINSCITIRVAHKFGWQQYQPSRLTPGESGLYCTAETARGSCFGASDIPKEERTIDHAHVTASLVAGDPSWNGERSTIHHRTRISVRKLSSRAVNCHGLFARSDHTSFPIAQQTLVVLDTDRQNRDAGLLISDVDIIQHFSAFQSSSWLVWCNRISNARNGNRKSRMDSVSGSAQALFSCRMAEFWLRTLTRCRHPGP
jgi:hypothetical protein